MANEKYLANTLYNVTTGAFYHEVGLPGDEDTGDDVITGGEVAAAKVVVGDQTAVADLALADITAAAGEATAADLTVTNARVNSLEAKINEILATLRTAGLITPP